MTNWLKFFLALYILAGQPALLWWMLENSNLYQLAWLNAGVFLISRIISSILKPSPKKTASQAIASELLWDDVETDWNGITLIKAQETTVKEIEVAKVGTADDKLEDKSDKLKNTLQKEEKSDGKPAKNSGKTMREWVSTPKIVQPIWWYSYSAKRKKKKETKRGQRLIWLLWLAIAGVTACTLWEFLWCWGVALSLILGRLLYLIIGKLFDVNGFHNVKKLITNRLFVLMILGGIGYGAYSMSQSDSNALNDGRNNAVSYIKDWFKWNDEVDENEIYVFEWTGEVINSSEDLSGTDTELNENLTWLVLSWDALSGENNTESENNTQVDTGNVEPSQQEVKTQETQTLSPEEANKNVTMWEAIKSLLAWATLSKKTNITFKYVAKSNELYPYFKTAQEKAMLGTDTDPSKIVSCDTYITLKWLREWRNVWSYTSKNVKSVYWNKAAELWKLNGCEKWKYVKRGNL